MFWRESTPYRHNAPSCWCLDKADVVLAWFYVTCPAHVTKLMTRVHAPPPQVCWRLGHHQKQAQRCRADYGAGHHRIQRGLPPGPSDQPEYPVLSGPVLHEPHLHPHAHQPAQWVTLPAITGRLSFTVTIMWFYQIRHWVQVVVFCLMLSKNGGLCNTQLVFNIFLQSAQPETPKFCFCTVACLLPFILYCIKINIHWVWY